MSREFKSIYAKSIKGLIDLHHAMGYKFERAITSLHKIDDFALATAQKKLGITKEISNLWEEKKDDESDYTRYTRVLYLAKLSKFLIDTGINSIVPKLPRKPKSSFIPYVYSKDEINRIFAASDRLRLKVFNKESNIFSVPTLLRVLYSTGLRIGEATSLADKDVNLDDGWLHIEKSKNGKERTIPISKSLIAVLKQYKKFRNMLPLESPPNTFFVKLNGKKCGDGLREYFLQCLRAANIPLVGNGHGPRFHNLRHTFAVHSVVNMINHGIDVNVVLPVLSAYMGHDTIASTSYYIRLSAQIYPKAMSNLQRTLDVFPKLKSYETA